MDISFDEHRIQNSEKQEESCITYHFFSYIYNNVINNINII